MKTLKKILLILPLLLQQGCIFFSTYQSARLLRPGEFEGSAFASVQRDTPAEGYSGAEDTYRQVGAQAGFGITEHFNLRGRYVSLIGQDVLTEDDDYVHMNGEDTTDGVFVDHYVDIEPKFGFFRDHLALTSPVALILDGGTPNFQWTPTVIGSVYPGDVLEISLAAKTPLQVDQYGNDWSFAVTSGVTILPTSIPLTFTPELGLCWSEYGTMRSFGLAIGFRKR
ncbi:MAG: hypothetical protein ACQEQV_08095 [Fibrobacterota bacterium]